MEAASDLKIDVRVTADGQQVELAPAGSLRVGTSAQLHAALEQVLAQHRPRAIRIDFSRVTGLDSSGIATLSVAARRCAAGAGAGATQLRVVNLSPRHREVLALMPRNIEVGGLQHREPNFFERFGDYALEGVERMGQFYDSLADTSFAMAGLTRGRFPPQGSVTVQAVRIGVDALPIVALLSLLLGLVLGFQSADQLERFGAGIFTADIVGVGMFREFGPILTGIVLAGRSGSSMAAELGTMRVNEEIDALRTMGIDPNRFLVVPRMLAILLVQPCLTLMSNLAGAIGGFLIGTLFLQIPGSAYLHQSVHAVDLDDLFQGLAKSVVFAILIGTIACYAGLSVRGGAAGVGRATTRAVVAGIFMIIVADSIFTTVSTLAS